MCLLLYASPPTAAQYPTSNPKAHKDWNKLEQEVKVSYSTLTLLIFSLITSGWGATSSLTFSPCVFDMLIMRVAVEVVQ